MKTLFSLLFCTFLALSSCLVAAPPNLRAILKKEEDRDNMIRVRVLHEMPQLQLDIQGSYLLMNPDDKSDVRPRIHGKSGLLQPISTGLKWGEEFPDLFQVKIVPTQASTEIRLNGRPYKGSLTFYDVGKALSVVNNLFIEDYVADIMAYALTGDEPPEAIAALAIAARSTAYYQVQHPRNRAFWDVDGPVVNYPGTTDSDSNPATAAAIQQALRATRHMLLTDPTGSLDDAFYAPWTTQEGALPSENGAIKSPVLTKKAAVELANKGLHAPQILHAIFPTAILQRVMPHP